MVVGKGIGPGLRRRARAGLERLGDVVQTGARPVRSWRRATDRDLRRSYPHRAARTAADLGLAAGVTALAGVVGAATRRWWLVGTPVAVLAAGAARQAWRRRAEAGIARGLPPGSLDPGPDAFTDPDYLRRRVQRHGAVFKACFFREPMVAIADLPLATRVLREHADALQIAWHTHEHLVPGGTIRHVAEPGHTDLRMLFARALGPAAVRDWEPTMGARTVAHLARTVEGAAGRAGGIAPLAPVRELVLATFCELFLGVAESDPEYPEVSRLVDAIDPDRRHYATGYPDAVVDDMLTRLVDLAGDGRGGAVGHGDGAGARTSLVARLEALRPGAVGDPGVMRNVCYLTNNTRNDVAGLLMWIAKHLADHPELADGLAAAAGEDTARPAAARFVSETLRLSQSEYLFRRAGRDVRFDGTLVPSGWLVRVCIREIHRDPDRLPDPERFDPDRFDPERSGAGAWGRDRYAPFGIDHRSCIGEGLTRAFAEIFVLALAQGYRIDTVADGPVEMSRERHWAPSSRWRVVLQPRAGALS